MAEPSKVNLASDRLGAAVLWANDEFFAPKDNLVRSSAPRWDADRYTDRGKWMDGWETRRRRSPGHDSCLIRLGQPGIVSSVVIDTAHFKGNFPSHASIQAADVPGTPTSETLRSDEVTWHEILPKSELRGDSRNRFAASEQLRATHLRLNIYPDGGVARLRALGAPVPDWKAILSRGGQVNLANLAHGASIVAASDDFFSSANNVLLPGQSRGMFDGWETQRRRGPGHDWVVIRLAALGNIDRVVVDTTHFKGNAPGSFSIDHVEDAELADESFNSDRLSWQTLVNRQSLQPHTVHEFTDEIEQNSHCSYIRLNIYPDGGVARLRVFGRVTEEGREQKALQWINYLVEDRAATELRRCCGSSAWVRQMIQRRPFESGSELLEAASRVWKGLSEDDWLEAFAAHPRIGDRESAKGWSADEQEGTANAEDAILRELADVNRRYEEKFDHIYLVCATGKSAEDMLQIAKERLGNRPDEEMNIAAEEQRKITELRLERMLSL